MTTPDPAAAHIVDRVRADIATLADHVRDATSAAEEAQRAASRARDALNGLEALIACLVTPTPTIVTPHSTANYSGDTDADADAAPAMMTWRLIIPKAEKR